MRCPIIKVFQRNRRYVYEARAWDEILRTGDFAEALALACAGVSNQ